MAATRGRQPDQQKRRAILGAARELFAERGVDATSTREIASLAQTTERTLFKHFGTKDGLVHVLIEQVTLDMFRGDAYARISQPEPFTRAEFLDWHTAFLADRVQSSKAAPDTYRVLFRELFRDAEFRERYAGRWMASVLAPLVLHLEAMQDGGAIGKGHTPSALASAFFSLNLSYLASRFVLLPGFDWNDELNIQTVVSMFATLLGRGLEKH